MKKTILTLTALLLAGCGSEMASYLIAGSEINMTLERTKPYFWSGGWDLAMIVRLDPVCQRRHKLRKIAAESFKVDVYSPERGVFILNQGKRWYVAQLKTCEMQQFDEAPPAPGELVGTFRTSGGEFKFVPAADEK
ncbi:MAG: hypothetical protein Q8O34_13170 [Rhodocyclaceae bacterium]|nr:hypothetical protein [Rhodocyclaceae bacterium]